jgi:hypothetical protein
MGGGGSQVGARQADRRSGPRAAGALPRLGLYPLARRVSWEVGLKIMEAIAGHRRGDRLDFHLRASARDLLLEKSRAMRDEVEALAQTVMKAGSYPRLEDASRAVDAVFDALRDRVPPEVLLRLTEYLSEGEAARIRAGLKQRLYCEEGFPLKPEES